MFIQIHCWQRTKTATDMIMIAGIEKLPVFHLSILVIGDISDRAIRYAWVFMS